MFVIFQAFSHLMSGSAEFGMLLYMLSKPDLCLILSIRALKPSSMRGPLKRPDAFSSDMWSTETSMNGHCKLHQQYKPWLMKKVGEYSCKNITFLTNSDPLLLDVCAAFHRHLCLQQKLWLKASPGKAIYPLALNLIEGFFPKSLWWIRRKKHLSTYRNNLEWFMQWNKEPQKKYAPNDEYNKGYLFYDNCRGNFKRNFHFFKHILPTMR